jgi:hypothetical protein
MTIHQFLDVDEEAQISSFWDGTFIGQREEDGYLIICHQVEYFYVEYKVMKSTWDGKTLMHYIDMRAFENVDWLKEYLDGMDVKL